MTSSSSCSSNIQIKYGPIDAKHVSENIWNVEEDRKLYIRRVIPTYQGQEEISEEIIPLLQQSGFYWIKMRYLTINMALISALIERWKPKTHTFHMRCRECTITLQNVSVLLDFRMDESPLIGPTNLDWTDLCEKLLESDHKKVNFKLTHHFSQLNNHDGNLQKLERFTRAWILRFIGGVLFVDKDSSKVSLRYLQFLRDFRECNTYAWGPLPATEYKTKSIGVLWEPYTPNVMSVLPPICLVGSVAWCAMVPLICFQVIEWHQPDRVLRQFEIQQPIPGCPSQPLNIHGIMLKGK
ncbi:Protein MAIN-LIKE 1 [Glycine soja]